jgi:hypothetical protein
MIEVLKQAIEAIEAQMTVTDYEEQQIANDKAENALYFLRQLIANIQKQTPVAWVTYGNHGTSDLSFHEDVIDALPVDTPLYTSPQPREWIGLTDEERGFCINTNMGTGLWAMAKDVEAKLKEKNGIKE